MQEISKITWNEAGKNGLVLGLLASAYLAVSQLIALIQGGVGVAFLASVLNTGAWIAKFVLGLYLMRLYLQKMKVRFPEMDARGLRHYGYKIALLSALVGAGFYLAYQVLYAQDAITEAVQQTLADNPALASDASMESLDDIMSNLPLIAFISNLLYSFAFGFVLTRIFVARIIPANPFAGFGDKKKKDDED